MAEPGQETSPHALSHAGLSVGKHIGSSAQQLDAKSWEATRDFAFTLRGSGLTLPEEHENSKTTLVVTDFMETSFLFRTYKAPNNVLSESQP